MFKLWATIIKDSKILFRDKIGLAFMFGMPIILVIVITSLQAGTFELVNNNKIEIIICNKDNKELGKQFIEAVAHTNMFKITTAPSTSDSLHLIRVMDEKNAMIALTIPQEFTANIKNKANEIAAFALNGSDTAASSRSDIKSMVNAVNIMYQPVLQNSYLQSIYGAVSSAVKLVENKQLINTIYGSISNDSISQNLEQQIIQNGTVINSFPVTKNGKSFVPNATQHNVPAWTIFAMFFVVTSLGSNIVKEKLSGSFIRLKTLPSNYFISLISKQMVYTFVCLMQVLVIFSVGVWLFPLIDLPALNIPENIFSLIFVSILCGFCAVSYAICVGTFAQSQEQANGFGAVSIVIFAAIGGVMVPSFAMPHSFQLISNISPLHWCLETYYDLFLEGGDFSDSLHNLLMIICFIFVLQLLTVFKLKRNNII